MLSPRELQIVQLIAEGLTDNKIGKRLSISGKTVSTHRKNILRKLNLNNTARLIRYAVENSLIK